MIYRLDDKKLYVGNQGISRVYLGEDIILQDGENPVLIEPFPGMYLEDGTTGPTSLLKRTQMPSYDSWGDFGIFNARMLIRSPYYFTGTIIDRYNKDGSPYEAKSHDLFEGLGSLSRGNYKIRFQAQAPSPGFEFRIYPTSSYKRDNADADSWPFFKIPVGEYQTFETPKFYLGNSSTDPNIYIEKRGEIKANERYLLRDFELLHFEN